MNYTEKYHLPQWEETDRIMRSDFNEAMAGIEGGISTAQATADEANEARHAVGFYSGTGRDISIEVGFRPRLILISKHQYEGNDSSLTYEPIFLFANRPNSTSIRLTDKGFILLSPTYEFPSINVWGKEYFYIAFR